MTLSFIYSKVLTCPDFCVVGKQAVVPWRCKPSLVQLRSAPISLCSGSPVEMAFGTAMQSCTSKSLCQLRVPNLQKLSWEGALPALCRTSPNWLSLCSWKPSPAWSSLRCLHGWCPVVPVCTHPIRMHFMAPLEGHRHVAGGKFNRRPHLDSQGCRAAESTSSYLPHSTDAAQVAQSYYCTDGEAWRNVDLDSLEVIIPWCCL